MKKYLLLITYNLSLIAFCAAQNPLVKQWDKRFGGTSGDNVNSFQQTSDGGYLLGGISLSGIGGDKTQPSWGSQDYWIVKIDSMGIKQWDKRFGGTEPDYFSSFQQTTDGGYILCGYSYSGISGDKTQALQGGAGDVDYWIVKTDSLGIKQWDKDFGGTSGDYPLSLQQTADKGFILGGFSISGIGGDKTQANWDTIPPITYDYWIVKTDSLGNKQWDRDFGGTDSDVLCSLEQTADGGYILGGYSFSGICGDKTQPSWGGEDYWIIKTDSVGNKQWDKAYGGTNDDRLFSLQQTHDEGYILGGWSKSYVGGDKTQPSWGGEDYWIIKTDSVGNKQWDKDFGGTNIDLLQSLQETTDGGYILGGYSNSDSSGNKTQDSWGLSDYWIIKTDSLGNKQWDKDLGGTLGEELYCISQLANGEYLIAGDSYSPASGDKSENNLGLEQTWVVKTDSLGNKQWDKTMFTTGHDETGLAVRTKDGCYTFANSTYGGIGGDKTQDNWNGFHDYWIIKFCDTTSTTSITQIPDYPNTFSISPNPADKELRIKNAELRIKEIEIYDLFGRRVLHSTFNIQHSIFTIDISTLTPGIYFLKAGNEVRKFVKE